MKIKFKSQALGDCESDDDESAHVPLPLPLPWCPWKGKHNLYTHTSAHQFLY
jgi:hypothetical protein